MNDEERVGRPGTSTTDENIDEVKKIVLVNRRTTFFDFFVALCWYSCFLFMPTSTAILNVQLIFDSCFACTCFGSSSIFAYTKK